MQNPELNKIDPLMKQPERGIGDGELSPMEPPEAYAPPAVDRIAPEDMHPYLRKFCEEHTAFLEELKIFEETIFAIQKVGFTKELDGKLRHFFHFFDHEFVPHNTREDTTLFPLLNQRLIEDGEHAKGDVLMTAVDLMEDDHLKAMQLAAVVLNFLGLAFRLPDERSRLLVLDAALEQGKNLVELLRLHIFREDNIVFASAHRLITSAEFDRLESLRSGNQGVLHHEQA